MRKLSLSLLLIGMTSLGYSQYSIPEFGIPLHNSTISATADADYLSEVQGNSTPNQVKLMENHVSNWDPTVSPKFDKNKVELFRATFKSDQGYVVALYDNKGNIAFAEERFKNVALPHEVARSIAKEYPGWSFERSKYILQYRDGMTSRRFYKVVIAKGNKTKRLKIHVS